MTYDPSIRYHHHRLLSINSIKIIVIQEMNRLQILPNKLEVFVSISAAFDSEVFFFRILATDSSLDSSSDERLQRQRESSTVIPNPTSSGQPVTLQRKISDRKSKRVRAKQNDVTGSASSSEKLKKSRINE